MARGHARSNKLFEIGVKALSALVSLKIGSARMSGVGLANRISRLPRVLIRKCSWSGQSVAVWYHRVGVRAKLEASV
jgi:hypothetical protein